ncbi:MAG: translation initiation factor IF-2 [Planctomycetes bacterium]|nr:translation initiation factor IF-2 [Planctomycetota bacterium]
MAVRIYSLAKELKLDSKDLVDLCAKAGVAGKGSALASLTDDEEVRVRAFVAGGAKNAPRATASVVAKAEGASGTAAIEAAGESSTFRREDYIAPAGVTNKPPMITARADKEKSSEKKPVEREKSPPKPAAPAIRVAPLPPSALKTPPPTSAEPAPQKPEIKLGLDAFRAARAAGSTPLQAHMRSHDSKRKTDGPAAPPTPSAPRGKPGGTGAPPAKRPGGPAAPLPLSALEGVRDRKGRVGGKGAEADKALGGREQRQHNRKQVQADRLTRQMLSGDEDGWSRSRRAKHKAHPVGTAPRKGHSTVQIPCTVRSFSEQLGVRVTQVLAKLLGLGTMATINTELSVETVQLLALEFGFEIELRQAVDAEEQMLKNIEDRVDEEGSLVPRAPVVTFLGHVDHGKTSLLDRIIGINVVSGESGGITQHIRAYRIEKDGRPIAFVDTPGHEAFTQMRARGANVTDIAVLVVAADDGVMPQTEEAISHARAANVPIVIALNKVDLPGINYDRIYTQLVTAGLQPTEWGGDVELVRCSAHTGEGIDKLLETLLTIAELHDYRANPSRPAHGTCLEASLSEGQGVMAKVLVQNGTLSVGDIIVCGPAYGRIKVMYDTLDPNKTYESALPSTPVNISGLDITPGAGDHFYELEDIAIARDVAEKRRRISRETALGGALGHVTLETLHDRLGSSDKVSVLNLILRADVRGSIEAIQKELGKLTHDEVQVKVLQATVGGITEADIHLADASDAIVIGFNVVPDEKARVLAESLGVQVRRYDIIYQVTDDLKLALEGMLKPERREVEQGRALVQRTFSISRVGTIAGCRVIGGTIERSGRARVIRDSRVVGDYAIDSLKREKDDAREVREGLECGIKLANFNDLKEGDVLEVYRVEEVARTL